MRKILFFSIAALLSLNVFGQTNTFPTTGNVGIGTTSPDYTLHLNKTENFETYINNGVFGLKVNYVGGAWARGFLIENSQGTDLMLFAGYGSGQTFNYGYIGKAHNDYNALFYPDGATMLAYDSFVKLETTSIGTKTTGNLEATESIYSYTGRFVFGTTIASGEYIKTAANDILFFAGGTAKLTIDGDDGNVGIGTTTPTSKLTIQGGVSINGSNSISSVNGFRNFLQLKDPSHAAIVYNPGESTELMFGFHSNGNFYWGTGQNAGNNYSMFLTKTGNLGIPGKLTANEVEVKIGGWADFVFEPDYNLMTLKDLEIYIKENKHLPEIPTNSEVKENGISVGEMNAKLLQKIEELTLYTLQQQELIHVLLERVEKLENK